MANSIRIQNVSKHFESIAALINVTLKICPGEIFFLLGPSGCGKTTLLRTLAGFVFPDQGEIFFDDKVVTRVPTYLRNVGMVFQNYALWPHLSVRKNIAFGLEQLRIPRTRREERVNEMLRIMCLEGLDKRNIAELSGGQQQRVALARALVVRPTCLLLDEPLSNLDTQLRLQMRHELRSLCQERQITVIHVTHDQKEALSTADRIAVMNKGIICQTGTPEDIYRRPVDSFVAGFIGEANLIAGKVTDCSHHKIVVETALGFLRSEMPQAQFSPGESCTVCIRPETMQIRTQRSNEENLFPGQIETATFLGESIEYRVQTRTDRFKVLDWSPADILRSSQIFLTVAPRHVIVLKK